MGYNRRPAMQAAMDEIYANRRRRLLKLIDDRYGWNQSTCAKAIRFSRTALNDYACGAKPIGERAAASIEQKAKLPSGWLDKQDSEPITKQFSRGRRPWKTNTSQPKTRSNAARLVSTERCA